MSGNFTVRETTGFTLVHVMTRGKPDVAASALTNRLGLDIAFTPNSTSSDANELKVLWFGPGRWLIHAATEHWHLDDVAGCSVTDLSDSRRLFRLNGAGAADRLATACPLDLADTVTPPGSCALTLFDQFPVLLYRPDNDSYDLYVERSYCDDLLRVLEINGSGRG
jgi:sarcosine oxidase subunit gamma